MFSHCSDESQTHLVLYDLQESSLPALWHPCQNHHQDSAQPYWYINFSGSLWQLSIHLLSRNHKGKESLHEVHASFRTQTTCLRDQLIVIGQVGSAVDTAVCSVTAWQISLESFGLGHLHHVCCTFLTQLRADAGRAAALPDSVTKETLENAHKSRCCLGQRVALSTQLGWEEILQPVNKSDKAVSYRKWNTLSTTGPII